MSNKISSTDIQTLHVQTLSGKTIGFCRWRSQFRVLTHSHSLTHRSHIVSSGTVCIKIYNLEPIQTSKEVLSSAEV